MPIFSLMINVDYIIIGQGISGTWLSYYLLKKNKTVIVIDKNDDESASNVAGGLINPVTGRRVVTTWMADELLPFIYKEYKAIGDVLSTEIIRQKNITVFPSAPDLQEAFDKRMQEENSYIKAATIDKDLLRQSFNFPFNAFEISPCYIVNMRLLLSNWQQYLQSKNVLLNEFFNETQVEFKDDLVQYKNISAKKIIYADGIQSANSKYWRNLPFVQNKGQALLIEIDDLNDHYIYKFGHLTLVPFEKNNWWVGSSNELSFTTNEPTEDFRNKTMASLKSILKKDFIVKEHWSSLRPATVERRPFVGLHPLYNQLAILNGMGSKGCSLAPWFAKQLADNLVDEKPLDVLADVQRFSRMLSR